MSSTGSDSEPLLTETETPQTPPSEKRSVPLKLIVIGIANLVFALFVGTQVLGVLVAILFPPSPPVPDNLTQVSHTSVAYGVGEWLYETPVSACDIVRYYQDQQGTCSIAPLWCGDDRSSDQSFSGVNTTGQHVARCYGVIRFSLFAMQWQAIIATADNPEYQTEFRLVSEIFWTGDVPPIPQN